MAKVSYDTIEAYLDTVKDGSCRERLERIRAIVREETPGGTETISWGIPTMMYHGLLLQYAACKGYIGFYPMETAVAAFAEELKERGYRTTKGAVHLPLKEPLPEDLVRRMARFRARENEQRKL